MNYNVYENLKNRIRKGELNPGEQLIEQELCNFYELSRTPIREILWQLVTDGLVEKIPNKGYYIKSLNLDQIFEIFQSREGIEGIAIRLACEKSDPTFIRNIKNIKEELLKVNVEKDIDKGIMLGKKLHNSIVEAANNNLLTEFFDKLKNLSMLTSNLTRRSIQLEKRAKESHIAIIDALLSGDENNSEKLLRQHLREACKQLIDSYYPNLI